MFDIDQGIHAGYSRSIDDTGICNLEIDSTQYGHEGNYKCREACEGAFCPWLLKEYNLIIRGERE